ncbi:AAA family ATPase [Rhizobium pusense]|uniref:AAA family ATPase n=1 Tax=Agrobacterium pusense TaxID=648995 RepID=UPI001FCA71CA|nr:AAA family ATPase [Agrobacterium pusense]MCJ2874819.1 AAA family ATPase [Agrobacterium pusense]
MKKTTNTNTVWEQSQPLIEFTAKHPASDVAQWRNLTARTVDVAVTYGWTKAEVSRRSGVPEGTFSPWFGGKYLGILANVNQQMANWLDAIDASQNMAAIMPVSPPFQRTTVGQDVYNALLFAQVTSGFVRVTLPAGSGKTTAAKHFAATRPHVFMATLSPSTKTVHGMLVELCGALEVHEHNPAKFVRALGAKLKRVGEGSLLIIDEAQNAVPDAINQLRHFVDNDHCGVALLGNEDTATAFVKDLGRSVASRAQVLSRFDRQVRTARNPVADAEILIKAWGIDEGTDCATFLKGIASKPGALRQIDRTMKAASMLAIGDGEEGVRLEHLQAAWKNRDMGDSL